MTVDILLALREPAALAWGPELVVLYNDPYLRLFGDTDNAAVLGVPVAEARPEIWATVRPDYEQVMRGEGPVRFEARLIPLLRHGRLENVYWTSSFNPVAVADAPYGVGGVLVLISECSQTTMALRASDEQQLFLSKLSDALRPLADPEAIRTETCRLLGEHLQADWVVYGQIDVAKDFVDINRGYAPNGKPLITGKQPLSAFGWTLPSYKAGTTVIVSDTMTSDRVPVAERPAMAAIGMTALISVPLLKNDELVGALAVSQAVPRAWTEAESRLVEETAERIWDAIERARAESALRDSEGRLAADLAGMRRLYDVHANLAGSPDFGTALDEILDAAVTFTRTDLGTIQLITADGDRMEIVRDHGYAPDNIFVEHFRTEGFTEGCDAARAQRQRLVIEDTSTFPGLVGTADGEAVAASEVRAAQSTPMISRNGELIGILSTQFRGPHRPTDDELRLIDLLAWTAAEYISRHRADQALRESEARFRLMADAAPLIVWITDAAGQLEFFNRQWADYIGTPDVPPTAGDVATSYVHPDDAERTMEAFEAARASGGVFAVEHRIQRSDGVYRWFLVRAEPYRDSNTGEIVRWFGASVDIDDRRVAEAALRESEQRFRSFAETSTDTLWIVDAQSERLDYLSPAYERIWGEPREAVMADLNLFLSRVHPDERVKANEGFQILKSGRRLNFEYQIVRPDGSTRYIHNAGFPIMEDGQVRRLAGVAQDLTERRLAERALAESERRARSLMEGVPQLVWRAVDHGQWTWASPQWVAFTGQPEQASHGKGWLETIHPDERDAAVAAWERAVETGGFDLEYRIRRSDGSYVWFATRATPVRDEHGAIVEWLGTSTEIHAMRELQERQGVLVAELQHRTRNLIAVVRSLARKTVEEAASLDDFEERFGTRLVALSRVQGLLSHLTAGQRVTFDELLGSELNALGAAGDGREKVTLDGPSGVSLRSATVQTFALALHELATNATKYGALSAPAGHLAIRWRVETDGEVPHLHVDWRESGVDMSPDGASPQSVGYGRQLIERALPYQLKAKTTYKLGADGVHCTITVPIASGPAETENVT